MKISRTLWRFNGNFQKKFHILVDFSPAKTREVSRKGCQFSSTHFYLPLGAWGKISGISNALHIFGFKKFFEFAPNELFAHILNINYTPADLEIVIEIFLDNVEFALKH